MVNNYDYQFRLLKKEVPWVGKVHELPELVKKKQNLAIIQNNPIIHNKTLERQKGQDEKYAKILTKKNRINKIIYDSVLFTKEGITKHAVEEIRELVKRGYNIKYINDLPRNVDEEKQFLLTLNNNIDIYKDDYFTIINQPPVRWSRSYGLNNLIGYLAFEGVLIPDWIKIINESPILELWTPSNYCKNQFIKDGIKKPIYVIPHGVDPEIWKPIETKNNDTFKFLWAGTAHVTRKGLDLAVKAFSEEFKEEGNKVKLKIKSNKIYNTNQDINKLVYQNIVVDGNDNIEICDEDLKETEFVNLMNSVDCYVAPTRSEGFGIITLQAIACNTPVITTVTTGHSDFCNEKNCFIIDCGEEKWADWHYPYWNTKWKEPSLESLKKQMRKVYDDRNSKIEMNYSDDIRTNWTWENTVNKIEERLIALQKG